MENGEIIPGDSVFLDDLSSGRCGGVVGDLCEPVGSREEVSRLHDSDECLGMRMMYM